MSTPAVSANRFSNPYASNLANFANAYASTDPMEFYGNQVGLPFGGSSSMNPMVGGGQFGDMMGMFSMMGTNPMALYNPLNQASMDMGRNPYDAYSYRNNPEAQRAAMDSSTAIETGLANLHGAITSDNQDSFYNIYTNLYAAIKNDLISRYGYSENDERLDRLVKQTIAQSYQRQAGKTLTEALQANGDSPFWQGCKDVLSLGILNDKRTVQDNINLVTNGGTDDNAKYLENNKQTAGRVVTTAGSVIVGGSILKGVGAFLKNYEYKVDDKFIKAGTVLTGMRKFGGNHIFGIIIATLAIGTGIWAWYNKNKNKGN